MPNQLVGKSVEIRATTATIEILHAARRVASHERSYGPKGTVIARADGTYTTLLARLARIEVLVLDDFLLAPKLMSF